MEIAEREEFHGLDLDPVKRCQRRVNEARQTALSLKLA
jgi:hypothetical protein